MRATCTRCGKSIQADTVGEEITMAAAMEWAATHACVPPGLPR